MVLRWREPHPAAAQRRAQAVHRRHAPVVRFHPQLARLRPHRDHEREVRLRVGVPAPAAEAGAT